MPLVLRLQKVGWRCVLDLNITICQGEGEGVEVGQGWGRGRGGHWAELSVGAEAKGGRRREV